MNGRTHLSSECCHCTFVAFAQPALSLAHHSSNHVSSVSRLGVAGAWAPICFARFWSSSQRSASSFRMNERCLCLPSMR